MKSYLASIIKESAEDLKQKGFTPIKINYNGSQGNTTRWTKTLPGGQKTTVFNKINKQASPMEITAHLSQILRELVARDIIKAANINSEANGLGELFPIPADYQYDVTMEKINKDLKTVTDELIPSFNTAVPFGEYNQDRMKKIADKYNPIMLAIGESDRHLDNFIRSGTDRKKHYAIDFGNSFLTRTSQSSLKPQIRIAIDKVSNKNSIAKLLKFWTMYEMFVEKNTEYFKTLIPKYKKEISYKFAKNVREKIKTKQLPSTAEEIAMMALEGLEKSSNLMEENIEFNLHDLGFFSKAMIERLEAKSRPPRYVSSFNKNAPLSR